MKIHNVKEIFDNGEFVTIVTESGTSIHLPMNSKHSITINDIEYPLDSSVISISIDLYQ